MSHLITAALVAAFLVGCGAPEPEATRVRESGLNLSARLEPTVGRVGENRILFELTDEQGQPVADAELSAKVHMHAMGAMPAMGGMTSVTNLRQGRYQADFELEMGSTWLIEIQVDGPTGESLSAKGSLTVGTPGLRLETRAPRNTQRKAGADTAHPAQVYFDPGRLQRIGVRTASVEETGLAGGIRTVGRVTYDETTLREVSLKVSGWVGELKANSEGILVKKGQLLFTLYSPELLAAQEEFLEALRSQAAAKESSAPERADYLVRAAKRRLRLWDISSREIEALAMSGESREYLPVRSPSSGFVIQKHVVEGSAVSAGTPLFRIAPIDRVWVEADVYESELSSVAVGQDAIVSLPHEQETITGRVAYVYPYLEKESRTARVRVELENPDLTLRPDMFVNVSLQTLARTSLAAPESAVLHAGEHSYVFLEIGDGRFEPREVSLGSSRDGVVEIRSGLDPGDRIVVSGTFLIASESRLRAALEDW